MLKNEINTLLEAALHERKDLFLIDFSMSPDHQIKITIDGDNGVKLEDCIFVSRAIEHNIDRDTYDFSLEVASAGATTPLINERQYVKNIGRNMEVKTKNEAIQAVLVAANETAITLQWKTREPKPVGKGKVVVKKEKKIAYNEIVEARVKIKF